MRIWSAKEHGGEPESWAVVQDARGVIYVANRAGVLEYDGARWRLIQIGEKRPAYALASGPDGRIYVGSRRDLGYLAPDRGGQMQFVSLLDRIPPAEQDFAQVWNVWSTSSGMVFGADTRQIRLRGDEVETFTTPAGFWRSSRLGDRLFVRGQDLRLFELRADQLEPIPRSDARAKGQPLTRLVLADPADPAGAILFTLDDELDSEGFLSWPGVISPEIFQAEYQSGLRLPDGRLALGTLRGGLYLFDPDGHPLAHWTQAEGLPRGRIIDLALDRDAALWLATGSGLARIRIGSPLTRFDEGQGLLGAVYSVHRHQGRLYVGTSLGLFRLEPGSRARFVAVGGVPNQVWDMLSTGQTLLVAHYEGVSEIAGEEVRPVLRSPPAMALEASRVHPRRFYVGRANGLTVLQLAAGAWTELGNFEGVDEQIKALLEAADGSLWASATGKGLLRLRWPEGADVLRPTVERFGIEDGLPATDVNRPFRAADGVIFATTRGIYRFDEARHRFEPDPALAGLFGSSPRRVTAVAENPERGLWMTVDFEEDGYVGGLAERQPDGSSRWNPSMLRGAESVGSEHGNCLLRDADGVVWLGGAEGLYRYDPRVPVPAHPAFEAMLRRVVAGDGEELPVTGGSVPRLRYTQNRLRFELAAPSLDSDANQYQVWLEGNDAGWSAWSTEAFRDYSNLWEGDYRLRVRARNLVDGVSSEAVMSFTVLPPWYRTIWAYSVYLLAIGGMVSAGYRWRLRRLHHQRQVLREQVAEQTRELAVKNQELHAAYQALEEVSLSDQLTGLRNRRFLVQHLEAFAGPGLQTLADGLERRQHEPPETTDLVLFLIDLDHFKRVNDTHGHRAGDMVLVQFADLLREVFRESDPLVRWGGEEFLAVARSCGRHRAAELAERVRERVATHGFDLGDGLVLEKTCSIGFACFPFFERDPAALSWQQVAAIADRCLYAAKKSQRNAWVGVLASEARSRDDFLGRWNENPQALVDAREVEILSSITDRELVWA
ncbi:MAG: diguanylate cyclase [Thermoanaerobaculia bacterium]|nr:diguanylate cyclase [Thermoanaerobaculia bacterium]